MSMILIIKDDKHKVENGHIYLTNALFKSDSFILFTNNVKIISAFFNAYHSIWWNLICCMRIKIEMVQFICERLSVLISIGSVRNPHTHNARTMVFELGFC